MAPEALAEKKFQHLSNLFMQLGLPIDMDKRSPPSRILTCLGNWLKFILNAVKYSKSHFRDSISIITRQLIYIHKCVHPGCCVVINRMLTLFRANPNGKKIVLTSEFKMDLKFLPNFNGINIIDKNTIAVDQTLYIDASLTDLGRVWNNKVYCTPTFPIADFSLKIVHLEMLNIVVALRLWGARWAHSVVTLVCDNLWVVQVVDTGRSRDTFLASCARNIWLILQPLMISCL